VRLPKVLAVAHDERAGPVRQEHPFVRVERHAVGALDAAEALATALGEDEEAPVRGVDVHPQAVLLGDVCHRVERIHRAGVRRAGARPDEERRCRPRISSTMRRKASASIRSSPSVGTSRTFRFVNPASVAAFVTDACACSLT
jgi:hypothetical protein